MNRAKIILYSILAVVIFWISDAAVNSFIFHLGPFSRQLAGGSPHDLNTRLFAITALLIFGFMTRSLSRNEEHLKMRDEMIGSRQRFETEVARTQELCTVNALLRKEIEDRSRTEEELTRSERFLSTIFDSFHDPFCILDRDYEMVKFNDAYARTKNKSPKELLGKTCHELFHDKRTVCDDCVIEKTFLSRDPCAKEKYVQFSDGSGVWFEIYTYPIFDEQRNVSHVVEYMRDITDRKRAEEDKKQLIENLNYLSTTDVLTGLFNRRALTDALQREIARAQRHGDDLSLILCDLDRFKEINDSYGHASGDVALRAVAEALVKSIRKSDIVGRYGGDEFMIVLPETSLAGAKLLAEKIRSAVSAIELDLAGGETVHLSLSLGVADCCTTGDTLDTMIKLADGALYRSKQTGRNKVSAIILGGLEKSD